MADLITYISVLNPEFSSTNGSTTTIPMGVGTFGYASFLNIQPPSTGGGGGTMSLVGSQNITVYPAGSTATIQGPDLAAYLTTAAGVSHTHGALSLVNLTGTSASNGLTLSAAAPGGGAAIMVSAGTTSGNVQTLAFSNGSGISFGLNGSTITGSHNAYTGATTQWLTTAAQVSHIHGGVAATGIGVTSSSNGLTLQVPDRAGTNGAITGGSITVNTSGVSIDLPAYLTTAMPAAEPHIRGIVYSNATQTSGTLYLSGSNGITIRSGANTAIIEFDGHHMDALIPSGGGYGTGFSSMTSGTIGLNFVGAISGSQNGNNLSISVPAQTVQPAVGLNTAATSVTWTVNSSGISINAGAYLTTAAGVSHTHGAGPTLTGPVAATSASNGLSLNVNAIGNTTAATNVTWTVGTNGLSLNAAGYAGTGTSATNASITLNSNGLAINVAAPGGGSPVAGRWAVPPWGFGSASNALLTNITGISRRFLFMPFEVANSLSFNEFHWPMSRAATGVNRFSVFFGIYTHVNYSSIQTIWNTSVSYSNAATASGSGLRGFEATWASTSLSPGQYVLGIMFDPVGGSTSAMNYSLMGAATGNTMLGTQIVNGADTYHQNVDHAWLPFHGRYSATTAAVPANVVSNDLLIQNNSTNIPLPMYWVLGTHY